MAKTLEQALIQIGVLTEMVIMTATEREGYREILKGTGLSDEELQARLALKIEDGCMRVAVLEDLAPTFSKMVTALQDASIEEALEGTEPSGTPN